MNFTNKSFFSKIVCFILSSFFIFNGNVLEAKADFSALTLCKESPAFTKRLNSEVKKLENRLKLYTPESKESKFLLQEIESTKLRFERYGNSNLLCGKEGLPRIIASGQWDHANEFVIPGVDRKSQSVIELRRKVQQFTICYFPSFSVDLYGRLSPFVVVQYLRS